ncbi:SusD/RagB family nutrient-binding outer membrane lipoprotein [Sphingobacterium sp. WOUb80]|uniref:SusD/RagB family nutrient-binding outer membrane lipoprotein n=1 Tax=Sphingobacterium sp. WOUb80 TaxID=3234028 RepID=UPI003CF11A7E
MKKMINPIASGLVVALLISTSSCTKDFEKINTNPYSYSKDNFNPGYLLTTSQLTYTGSTDFAYDTWRSNLIYASTMMQGLSTVVSYWAGDKYVLNEAYTASYWGTSAVGAYAEQVRNIVDLVENTKDDNKYNNLHQIGRIWKVLIFARLTDIYGDIPYSEAGKGYTNKIYTPKYDKQQDIYNDMLKELDEAVNTLTVGGGSIVGDVIYKGDIEKWKQFGNSLILRLAMRLIKVDESKAKEYVTKVVGKTLTSNDNNAYLKHDVSGARVTQNRNSQVLLGDGGQEHYYTKWSKTFIDYLKKTNDPRLGKIAVTKLYLSDSDKKQNADFIRNPSVQKGMPNGKDLGAKPEWNIASDPAYTNMQDYSSPHPDLIRRDGPTFILTYAETELLWAEAAQRWGLGGGAADHYKKALKASLTYLSEYSSDVAISEADAEAYAIANPLNTADALNQINSQYWAHTITMLDFYETWANWRRTGYPNLTSIGVYWQGAATDGVIPRRFPYPISEASENPANYKAASAAVSGGDKLSGRVWWDK